MSNQSYPLHEKMKNSDGGEAIPRELELKIREDFQKNPDLAALEEQYSSNLVHQVLGTVKNDGGIQKGDRVKILDSDRSMARALATVLEGGPGSIFVLTDTGVRWHTDEKDVTRVGTTRKNGDGTEGGVEEKKENASFKVGDEVKILTGTYRGEEGVVTLVEGSAAQVELDDDLFITVGLDGLKKI